MREILFRGKRIDINEWIEGYYAVSPTDSKSYIYAKDYTEVDIAEDGLHMAYRLMQVIPETAGQFVGLTDKNGNKIFEGDIVRLFDISVGEIVQECGAFGIGCRKQIDYDYLASEIAPVTGNNNTPMFCYNDNFVSLWELWWNYNEESDEISVIEVIGNIHDNPELLEVTESR